MYITALASISKPFSPAKTVFTGIGVLLGVSHLLHSLVCSHVVFNSDGEGCQCELRNACASLRAHTVFPPASQSLHSSSTHARDDGVTRKDHGPDSFHSCALDQGNEGGADQSVFLFDLISFLADCDIEKFLKRLMGKTEAENAFQRLDMLTKEENLMTSARTLEATYHVQRLLPPTLR